MKKLLLTLVCITALTGSAMAGTRGQRGDLGGDQNILPMPVSQDINCDTPVRPAPEPGTMALASMGLIALGAAARKRWNR